MSWGTSRPIITRRRAGALGLAALAAAALTLAPPAAQTAAAATVPTSAAVTTALSAVYSSNHALALAAGQVYLRLGSSIEVLSTSGAAVTTITGVPWRGNGRLVASTDGLHVFAAVPDGVAVIDTGTHVVTTTWSVPRLETLVSAHGGHLYVTTTTADAAHDDLVGLSETDGSTVVAALDLGSASTGLFDVVGDEVLIADFTHLATHVYQDTGTAFVDRLGIAMVTDVMRFSGDGTAVDIEFIDSTFGRAVPIAAGGVSSDLAYPAGVTDLRQQGAGSPDGSRAVAFVRSATGGTYWFYDTATLTTTLGATVTGLTSPFGLGAVWSADGGHVYDVVADDATGALTFVAARTTPAPVLKTLTIAQTFSKAASRTGSGSTAVYHYASAKKIKDVVTTSPARTVTVTRVVQRLSGSTWRTVSTKKIKLTHGAATWTFPTAKKKVTYRVVVTFAGDGTYAAAKKTSRRFRVG